MRSLRDVWRIVPVGFPERCTRPQAARSRASSAADSMSDAKGPGPSPIPPPDRYQIERLNSLYQIIDSGSDGGGLQARLASGARRLLGRVLSRQQEFNAVVVDHLNRNTLVASEAHRASVETIEWVGLAVTRCDEVRRYAEALLARERRGDAAITALAAQHDELRTAISVIQQATQNLKREVARVASLPSGSSSAPASAAPPSTAPGSQFDDVDSHKYVGFEDRFRGSP